MTTLIVIRIAHIACCVLAFGLPAFELLILRPACVRDGSAALDHLAPQMRRACLFACVIALASWVAWLAQLASQMSGQPLTQAVQPDVLATVLSQTTFGRVWLVRAALLIGVVVLVARHARPTAVALLSASVLASLAWTGHALGAHAAHAFIDAAHALAAGLWVGMLVPLLWTIHRALASDRADFHRLANSAARRFTLPGVLAVLTLAVSGALNAWWLVGSIRALLTSDYGLMVTAKIVVFASMLALASTNRWMLLPRVDALVGAGSAARPLRLLRASVALELAFGLSVLVLVGVLGITPPAAHEHTSHRMHHMM